MKAVGVFETLRVVYQVTLFNISEDSNLQQHRCEHHKCDFVFLYIALPAVAYPGIFFGGFQQIQPRTERTGIWRQL
jgi:hypothetical protein